MALATEDTLIGRKTRELCELLLEEPSMKALRRQIDDFLGDEKVREQYDGLVNKGQALHQKQQMSVALSEAEIADFEQHRDAVLSNPVARGFLDAQQEMRQVQQSIHQYVSKTLELGRLPSAEELHEGGCGHDGCGSCSC